MKILKLLMAFILCITLVGCQTTTNQNSGENTNISQNSNIDDNRDKGITLDNLPEYPGEPFVALYNNVPDFDNEIDKAKKSFETYSDLDSLGRCGVAYAEYRKRLDAYRQKRQYKQCKACSTWYKNRLQNRR